MMVLAMSNLKSCFCFESCMGKFPSFTIHPKRQDNKRFIVSSLAMFIDGLAVIILNYLFHFLFEHFVYASSHIQFQLVPRSRDHLGADRHVALLLSGPPLVCLESVTATKSKVVGLSLLSHT